MCMLADIVARPSGDCYAVFVHIQVVAEPTACGEARLTVALGIPTLKDQQPGQVCEVAALTGVRAADLTTGQSGWTGEVRQCDLIWRRVGGNLKVVASGSVAGPQQATAMLVVGPGRVETGHSVARQSTRWGLRHTQGL